MEPVILDEVAHRTGLAICGRQRRVTHPEHAHHLATLDAYAADHPDADLSAALAVVEVKNTSDWSWADDVVPLHYYLQGQWQMHVTGLSVVLFAVLHAGTQLGLYEVERDDEDIFALVAAVDAFWPDYVLARVEPPVSGQDLDAVRDQSRGPSAGVLEADPGLEALVDQLRAVKASASQTGGVVDELSARLVAALGRHDELVDRSGLTLATWKAAREFDVAAAVAAHPEVAALCTRPVLDEAAFRKALGRKASDAYMRADPDGARRLLIKNPRRD